MEAEVISSPSLEMVSITVIDKLKVLPGSQVTAVANIFISSASGKEGVNLPLQYRPRLYS